eukprot:gnl/MRDRNA2_/MRDRNA2_69417_c0_seq2.p1 gnl/MRDRNA2_/MRDRNA2_69417_c0~~gnl/MRDRNA2_/MRDRNA2_69417_c0_seq2.p1  ORF type:complete len:246 (+),score=44.60 gnl/MRDRNA2_/MRDRNA2_69417_c0_seq2:88-738(+)
MEDQQRYFEAEVQRAHGTVSSRNAELAELHASMSNEVQRLKRRCMATAHLMCDKLSRSHDHLAVFQVFVEWQKHYEAEKQRHEHSEHLITVIRETLDGAQASCALQVSSAQRHVRLEMGIKYRRVKLSEIQKKHCCHFFTGIIVSMWRQYIEHARLERDRRRKEISEEELRIRRSFEEHDYQEQHHELMLVDLGRHHEKRKTAIRSLYRDASMFHT